MEPIATRSDSLIVISTRFASRMNIDSCLTFFFCIFLTIIYQEAGTLYVDETTCNICMAESQHAKDTTAMGPGISDLQGQKKRFLGGGFKYILYFHPTY